MDAFVIMHLHNAAKGKKQGLARFFEKSHVPAVKKLRGFEGVQRFRITKQQLHAESAQPWDFATKYDFALDDPAIDLPAIAPLLDDLRREGLVATDGAERTFAYRMYHSWHYSENLTPGEPLSHLMFLLANITPGQDEAYHRWYDEVHRYEVSEAPGYVGMQRGKLAEVQVPPEHYCPGSELILGALQCDDLAFTIKDFIDRAYGRSPSGVAWSPRPKSASIARTVHLAESVQGPFPKRFVPKG